MRELIAVIVLAPLVLFMVMPTCWHCNPRRARRIYCVNNLKMTGTAFRLWAMDFGGTNELYPTQLPTNAGGASEPMVRGEVWRAFQLVSNELNTPKILICPADTRQPAALFDTLRNANLSCFVGRDADLDQPDSLLAGDRNLEVAGQPVTAGRLTLTIRQPAGWTDAQHQRAGNLLMGDGSVRLLSHEQLQKLFVEQSSATTRLVIP